MKNILVVFGILAISLGSFAQKIALTFDDCPRKSGPLLEPMERDRKLVSTLKKAGITAAFFCNSPGKNPSGKERIKYFSDHGHLIANHSADHPDANEIPVEQFTKNIDQVDLELRSFPTFRKWFRFPFLHEGKEPKDVEAIRAHLKSNGYTNGYVTVDTEDWYVDELLRQKVVAGEKFNESRLCKTYSSMLVDEAKFFDEMSVNVLHRSVKHVILLHETDLNAICLMTIIDSFKKAKWDFISPDEAYSDPVALQEPKSTSKLNNGRIFALAKDAGYAGPYFFKWIEETAIQKELIRQKVWK